MKYYVTLVESFKFTATIEAESEERAKELSQFIDTHQAYTECMGIDMIEVSPYDGSEKDWRYPIVEVNDGI